MGGGDEVRNKQVVLRQYVTGFPKEEDMAVTTSSTIRLKLPEGSAGVLVKNLYLSCDPYMRLLMKAGTGMPGYLPHYAPGSGTPEYHKGVNP